jgi:Cys-tRNA(Pro)/Cys-tRNA(Cys) deacylase
MSTRAIQFLKQRKIAFEVVTYTHEEKGAEFAAEATGYPLEMTVKTLVVEIGDKQFTLVLMPGDRKLSMKRLAKTCGGKRAAMADTKTAERLSGYLVGGISPFGTRQKLPVVMDAGIAKYEKILINAGQRGKMILVSPLDLQKALACTLAPVSQKKN